MSAAMTPADLFQSIDFHDQPVTGITYDPAAGALALAMEVNMAAPFDMEAEEEAAACLGAADETEEPLPLKEGDVLFWRVDNCCPPEQDVGGSPVTDLSGIQTVCIAGVTCPITPITPNELSSNFDPPIGGVPNWGDALGMELCLWVNSGMCVVDLSINYQSSQVPARPAGQLRGQECDPQDWRWRVFDQYGDAFTADERRRFGGLDWQGHHGVPSAWMERIFGTAYNERNAPVVLTPLSNHQAASDLWQRVGRNLDPRWG